MATLNPQPPIESAPAQPPQLIQILLFAKRFLVLLAVIIFIILGLTIYLLTTTPKSSPSPIPPPISQPSPTPQASIFQKILEEGCIRDNLVSGKIRTEKLPISINPKIVKAIELSCGSIGEPHTWYVFNKSYDFFVFDNSSDELGHGGISYFKPYGEVIVDRNRITYYVYLIRVESSLPIGDIHVNVRTIKEIKISNDERIYVTITGKIIEADDPRLISILNLYSMPSEIYPGKKEVSDYEKAENAISARFFGNFDSLESPERERVESLKQILSAFSEK